jgi:hypothetical protein
MLASLFNNVSPTGETPKDKMERFFLHPKPPRKNNSLDGMADRFNLFFHPEGFAYQLRST